MFIDKTQLEKIKNKYEGISDLDAKIILLREESYSYGVIQLKLGNPSKKYIRSVLMNYAPKLVTTKVL